MGNILRIHATYVIDWLSVTHKTLPDGEEKPQLQQEAYWDATKLMHSQHSSKTKAHNGYNSARSYPQGEIVQWHTTRKEMGTNYTYTGAPLKHYDAFKLVVDHVTANGRLRRVDLAIDTNAPLDIYKLYKAGLAGEWVTRCRTVPRYIAEEGETCYVGGKQSDEIVRIYDKNAEQKIDNPTEPWNRIELKLTDDKAENAGRALKMQGIRLIAKLIKGFVDFPKNAVWCMAFDNVDGSVLKAGERKMSNTKAWLMTQVVSTVAEVHKSDSTFMYQFLDEIQRRVMETRTRTTYDWLYDDEKGC